MKPWHWRARKAAHPWCSIDIKAAVPGWITMLHSPAGVQPCIDFDLEAAAYRFRIARERSRSQVHHVALTQPLVGLDLPSEPEDRIEVREGVEARFQHERALSGVARVPQRQGNDLERVRADLALGGDVPLLFSPLPRPRHRRSDHRAGERVLVADLARTLPRDLGLDLPGTRKRCALSE